jgi:hypothetical protein
VYGERFLVQQAYAEVKPHALISIDAGKFVTSASAEVIESNKNWLYSRSLLFTGVPLLHTGLRVNVAALGTIAAPSSCCRSSSSTAGTTIPTSTATRPSASMLTYTPATRA